MKDLEYDEFEVVLERSGDGYSARVADSPTGQAPAMPFVQPMEIADLPPLRETMRGAEAEAPAGAERAAKVDVKAFGTALFRALFNDKAISIFRTSQYVAAKNGHGLRLRIRFSDVAELTNLPWELLYDPDRHKYLSQYRAFPTVRLLDLPDPVPPIKISGPLRMLVVISGPKDLPELDVENEWMLLREKLDPLVKAGRIELVRLPVPTLDALRLKALAGHPRRPGPTRNGGGTRGLDQPAVPAPPAPRGEPTRRAGSQPSGIRRLPLPSLPARQRRPMPSRPASSSTWRSASSLTGAPGATAFTVVAPPREQQNLPFVVSVMGHGLDFPDGVRRELTARCSRSAPGGRHGDVRGRRGPGRDRPRARRRGVVRVRRQRRRTRLARDPRGRHGATGPARTAPRGRDEPCADAERARRRTSPSRSATGRATLKLEWLLHTQVQRRGAPDDACHDRPGQRVRRGSSRSS